MKRLIAILLCLVMLLALAACGNDDTQSTDPSTEPSQTATENTEAQTDETTEPTTEPTECPHEYEDSVTAEATCTVEGVKTFTCTKCGDSYTEAIEKSEHTYKDATCTDAKTCSVCGATDGDALGHSYNKATCKKAETCSRCGITKGSALGHNYKDATCTTPKKCSRCGATSGKALGHTHAAVTCTEGATCTVCGTAISAAGHKYADATCTAPKTCSVCGATEGNALGHSYKDATCTAPKTCSTCGATEGNALGHSWKDATCTAPKTCSTCGATEGSAEHSWKAATCTAPKTCSVCGATEGSALGHNYKNGTCTGCGEAEPTATVVGEWFLEGSNNSGWEYEKMYLTFGEGTASITISYYSKLEYNSQEMLDFILANGYYTDSNGTTNYYDILQYNGVYYYSAQYGTGGSGTYTVSGNTITVELTDFYGEAGTMTLNKTSASSLSLVSGYLFDNTISEVLNNGRVFTKIE